ncbi:MAG TPA: glycosyltransferase [Chlamydiales bacterium]|nr:glycosyltransferase [Chlamydiales bacterium]
MKRFILFLTILFSSLVGEEFLTFEQACGARARHYNFRDSDDFAQAYNLNHFAKVTPSESPRIPKLIHIIWFGSSLPSKYDPFIESWKEHHPDWTVKLWADDDIGSFPLVTGEKIFEATNLGQRSDIFRYELLNYYGGLYVDADFFCLKPHDILHHTCDFYSAMDGRTVYNGIIASAPNHPIIQHCLQEIKKITKFTDGVSAIVGQTGPRLMTRTITDFLRKSKEGVIVYPTVYFYSFPSSLRSKFWRNNQANFDVAKPYMKPHAFGLHMWAHSWMKSSRPPVARPPRARPPNTRQTRSEA